ALHEPFGDQPVDNAGDIAVGHQQEARQVAHEHAVRRAVERGHDVEPRQRGVELPAQALAQLRLDDARGAQQPNPQPQLLLRGGERPAHHVSPPESESAWPVMEPASSLHSHSTAAATSCGWMKRPCGLVAARLARACSTVRPVLSTMRCTDSSSMSDSTNPGQIALTVTPVFASSAARARISPTTPCLAATYGAT